MQNHEEKAREKEREERARLLRQRQELQAMKEYQLKIKMEQLAEEKRMEDEFKMKMAQKFAEDERIDQLNENKRRQKELEHRREIERLWTEKLTLYQEQREQEWAERKLEREKEAAYQEAITEYKQMLLAEHAALLSEFNPKAASKYGASVRGGQSQYGSAYKQ